MDIVINNKNGTGTMITNPKVLSRPEDTKYRVLGLTIMDTFHQDCDETGRIIKSYYQGKDGKPYNVVKDMLNTDSYYEIGAGHMFCQDYADHGSFKIDGERFRYAVVCDGCSGSCRPDENKRMSVNNTDIGARVLAKAFPIAFEEAYFRKKNEVTTETLADFVAESLIRVISNGLLGLPLEAFDTTLVAVVYDEAKDVLYSFAWGDGKIFCKYKAEHGFMTDITFSSGAPYYLSYKVNPQNDAVYENKFGDKYADVVPYIVKNDGIIEIRQNSKFKQKSFFEELTEASKIVAHACVFTDGIDTFRNKDDANKVMPKHNVFEQLTQYKGTHGEFVKRRMNAVKKFCQKEGWQHFDDISVAAITF